MNRATPHLLRDYKVFSTAEESLAWGRANYGELLDEIWFGRDKPRDSFAYAVYAYTASGYMITNKILRGFQGFDDEYYDTERDEAKVISARLCQYELPENIVVYRYTKKELFRYLFEDGKPKVGGKFTDKAFMSTTLVLKSIKQFAKEHQYDCLLKLYLPKGTHGAFVKFDKSIDCLTEDEFLLPTNQTFEVLGKKSIFGFCPVYECLLTTADKKEV
jgi:hypothetical protein